MSNFTVWKSLVNGVQIGLPSGTVGHYDAQALPGSDGDTVTEWPDELGSFDATASGTPTIRDDGINGNRAIELADGDYFKNTNYNQSQPTTIFIVIDQVDEGYVFSGGSHHHSLLYNASADAWRINAGTSIDGGSHSNQKLFTAVFNGDNSLIREGGERGGIGDVGSNSLDGLTIGNRFSEDNTGEGYFGEIVVCDRALSITEIEGEEQRLADKWGLYI